MLWCLGGRSPCRVLRRASSLEKGVYAVFTFVGLTSLLIMWLQLTASERFEELKTWARSVAMDTGEGSDRQLVPSEIPQFWKDNLDWSHLGRKSIPDGKKLCPAVPSSWTECGLTISLSRAIQTTSDHGTMGTFASGSTMDILNWTSSLVATTIAVMDSDCYVLDIASFTTHTETEKYLAELPSFRAVFGVTTGVSEHELPSVPWKAYHWFSVQNDTHFFTWFTSGGTISAETSRQPYRRQSLHHRVIPFGVRYNISLKTNTLSDSYGMQRGTWSPPRCSSRWNIALLIPYRDREEHLAVFLRNIIPFLQKQLLQFTIFLIEQTKGVAFNRGTLLNVGFIESRRMTSSEFNCFVFHDVDLVPEDLSNFYACTSKVRSLVTGRRHRRYKQYGGYMGGATSFTPKLFEEINGFSNKFYGWGGEDDNARNRVKRAGLKMLKVPWEIGRFTMLTHDVDEGSPHSQSVKVLGEDVRPEVDGLHTTDYEVKSVTHLDHFIRILVDIPGPKSGG